MQSLLFEKKTKRIFIFNYKNAKIVCPIVSESFQCQTSVKKETSNRVGCQCIYRQINYILVHYGDPS
ncbi:unnamed protein product [Callosobruchus maculatus]|uniref:Uncharacterized protein n=1 Tax=Callosobruchus maculatus TaxID=64391 RepID=A0A653CWH0_CALMS|nr:unnamed protein product [Callosobruchus maculatus]